jgi:hypothetical protein
MVKSYSNSYKRRDLELSEPIYKLIKLFENSKKHSTIETNFELIGHGLNGIVLKPKDTYFANLCIKSSIHDT